MSEAEMTEYVFCKIQIKYFFVFCKIHVYLLRQTIWC